MNSKKTVRTETEHLHFLESLDRINRAMQKAGNLDEMMSNVLDEVLAIFDCDRAFLLYPCDPDADSWTIPMERTKPEYPGAGILKTGIPMDSEVAETLRILQKSNDVLKFGPGTDHPLPQKTSKRFGFKTFMSIALYPKTGKPWEFGIHQCSRDRIWTAEEERLLKEISYRLADGLTSLLIMRDLKDSETKYRRIFDTAQEGIWGQDENFTTTFVNSRMAEMLGYTVKELEGRQVTDFMPKEDLADHKKRTKARKKHQAENYERRFVKKDGTTIWTMVSATPIFEGDRFCGSFIMASDITIRKEVAAALAASEQQFRSLAENTPDNIIRYDPQCRVTYFNPGMIRTLGIKPEILLGKTPVELGFGGPELSAEFEGHIRQVLKSGRSNDMEIVIPDPEGSLRTHLVRFAAERDAEGKVVSVLAIGRDITERKQAEQDIAARELDFRTLVENSSDPILRYDRDCKRVYVNPVIHQISGKPLDSLLGHKPEEAQLLSDSEAKKLTAAIRKTFDSDQPGHVEFEFIDLNDVPHNYDMLLIPEHNAEGRIKTVLGIARDITERKQAEQALALSEEKFSKAFQASPNLMAITRPEDGLIIEINDSFCRFFGYSRDECIGHYTSELHMWVNPEQRDEAIRKLEKSDKALYMPVELRTKSGEVRSVIDSMLYIHIENRKHLLSVATDITERKQAEEALRSKHDQLSSIYTTSPVGITMLDRDGQIIDANPQAEKVLGLKKRDILQLQYNTPAWSISDLDGSPFPDDQLPFSRVKATGKPVRDVQHAIQWPDGRRVLLSVNAAPLFDQSGQFDGMIASIEDITERKQAEMEMYRLNRELHAISNCNQALMMATDEQALLNDICNIICNEAGYRLAWVGYAENDEAKTIKPVAWAGEGSDYIANAELSWSEDLEHGKGPAGIVIRTGKTIYVEDFEDSELMKPWQQSALQHGYHSGIALPLKDAKGEPFGTLLIYSEEKNASSPDEIRLLEELAGDLAYGITNLRTRIESKQATEALAESEKLQRLLLDTLTQHVFYKDRDSIYISCNKTFAEGRGIKPEEVVGKTDFDLFPANLAEKYQADDKAVMKSGVPKVVEEPYEANGKKAWVHTVKTPMRDSEGNVTGVLGIFWDITEQHRAVQELEQSQANLAEAQRIAKLGSWELNLVTDELTWSDEMYEIFEIDKAEFGASYEAFLGTIHPDDRDMVDKAYTDSVKEHSNYEAVYRLLMKDGSIKFAQAQGRTDYDSNDNPLRSVGTVQDITHQQEVEEQLRQAQKMEAVGTLVGGIAHDFNNKLAAITGNLYLALNSIDKNSETADRLRSVETLSMEAANMVKQLLTFARKGTVEMAPVTLVNFIKESAKLNRVAIPENIHLSVDYGEDPLPITGDITQLQQLFLNLLTNARDAVEGVERARIDITLRHYKPTEDFRNHHPEVSHVEDFACLQLCDNGHGIAPEYQKQIFNPFFTTKEIGKGTGLGLAIVYGVVQSHHGAIEVKSSPEQGTCFSVYLPLLMDTETVHAPVQSKNILKGKGETILLADDDIAVLQTLADVLTSLGYYVLKARNGLEAVELFRQHAADIDLVILDIIMPEMKGPKVAERIREIDPDIKLLFATGYESPQNKEAILSDTGILAKPFDMDRVSRTIRELLDS